MLDEKLITTYKHHDEDYANALASNTDIQWTREIIETCKADLDWSTEGILGNWALPWSSDFLDFLKELAEDEIEEHCDEEELENILNEMCSISKQWDRTSNDKYREWTEEFIEENKGNLDWELLSQNTALPFSMNFFKSYQDYWDFSVGTLNIGI